MNSIKKKIDNKLISTIIVFLYILSPILIMIYNYFFDSSSINFWYLITIIFGICSLIVGILGFVYNRKREVTLKKIKPLIFLLIALFGACIATICSSDVSLSFWGGNYKKSGLLSYILYLGFFLNSFNINKKYIKNIFITLVFLATGMSIISLQNNSFTYQIFFMNNDPYNAIFYHFNHFGYYLSIIIILNIFLFMYEKKKFNKFLLFACYYVLVMTLIINNTFGSYLAVLAITIILTLYFILINKKSILILFLVFVLCSCFISDRNGNIVYNNISDLLGDTNTLISSDNSNELRWVGTNRWGLWMTAISYIKESSLIGYGPENATSLYEKENMNESSPHNFLLEIALYNGIPVLVCYLLGISIILIRAFLLIKKLSWYYIACLFACISYLISGLFGNIFFYTSPYFCICLGFLYLGVFKYDISIYKKIGKRLCDIVLSLILLIVCLPIMMISAIAVFVDSKGSIIYKHERVGLNGKKFFVYKFRTMYIDWETTMKLTKEEEKEFKKNYKLENDKRMTRVGKFLRKTSIDELPQLLNVLKGEMSLIGPRPVVEEELKKYKDDKELLLSVKPGISGNWACNGRNKISYSKRIKYELEYVKEYDMWFDFKLFWKTIFCVLLRRGVK